MSTQASSLVERFYSTLSEDTFIEAANAVLQEVDDSNILAGCAELATRRSDGGAYFQARLWSKALRFSTNKRAFSDLCRKFGVSASVAGKHAKLGATIEQLVQEGHELKRLQRASETILRIAQNQKHRMHDYLLHVEASLDMDGMTPQQIHRSWCKVNGGVKANLDIIKPSDWWAFGHPKWRSDSDFPGSIPGEIYANALYYFAPTTGVAADPMAGSGMLRRVYDDRAMWQKDLQFDLQVYLFDLKPARDYIEEHDARQPLPIMADWVFLDPPYFGQSDHLYDGGLASTKDYSEYLRLLEDVIGAMASSLNVGGRLCLLLPKWSGQTYQDTNYNIPADTQQIALLHGLQWLDFACVSRGRQQELAGARLNARAKRDRRMRSDTCILNVYEKLP